MCITSLILSMTYRFLFIGGKMYWQFWWLCGKIVSYNCHLALSKGVIVYSTIVIILMEINMSYYFENMPCMFWFITKDLPGSYFLSRKKFIATKISYGLKPLFSKEKSPLQFITWAFEKGNRTKRRMLIDIPKWILTCLVT